MANQPDLIPSAWAANNSTTETIPATTTESGKASWDQGFPVETSLPLSQGGIPPKYGDFNGVLNVLSQFCLFAQSGGQYAWVNSLDYSVGSIVLGTDGSIYRAAQVSGPSTAAVNPVGDTSGKWERIVSKSDIDALEEDIQDAMDAASDAVTNASAAQSAVSTLDANVVKLSGAQEVGGQKTFTSSPLMEKSTTPVITLNRTDTTSYSDVRFNINGASGAVIRQQSNGNLDIGIKSGTDAWMNGALFTLYDNGEFTCRAQNATTGSELRGKPDGTLTWVGINVNTAAKPGVQLVEYTYNQSVTINADNALRVYFTPPTISGYTAQKVVNGRGNGILAFVVPSWSEANNAWVINVRASQQTANSMTFLIEYTRN